MSEIQIDWNKRRISPKEMRELGWTQVEDPSVLLGFPPKPWTHRDGSLLEHCGHPTANFPWALWGPDGKMITAPSGRAWKCLSWAVQWHAALNLTEVKA